MTRAQRISRQRDQLESIRLHLGALQKPGYLHRQFVSLLESRFLTSAQVQVQVHEMWRYENSFKALLAAGEKKLSKSLLEEVVDIAVKEAKEVRFSS